MSNSFVLDIHENMVNNIKDQVDRELSDHLNNIGTTRIVTGKYNNKSISDLEKLLSEGKISFTVSDRLINKQDLKEVIEGECFK